MITTRARVFDLLLLLLIVVSAVSQETKFRIAEIEFFGYTGLDVAAIRASLPVREGAEVSESEVTHAQEKIKQAVIRASGLVPTDVAGVCCDDKGGAMIYIGLPGRSSHKVRLNRKPHGSLRLPQEIVDLYQQASELLTEAVKTQPGEDDSKGYALSSYQPLKEKQLAMRKWAMHHSHLLVLVLASSSDPNQRAVAAYVLGYAVQSKAQLAALTRASRDQDEIVRNNATRALGVLAESSARVAARIPATGFVAMLNSGIWKDRNKGSLLLEALTRGRDPRLLTLIRTKALDSLIEMARWRSPGHAYAARVILGRVAGIQEDRLQQLIGSGQTQVIIDALPGLR